MFRSAGSALPIRADRWKRIKRDKYLYLLLFPGLFIIFLFKYVPMYGIVIAFKEYNILLGVFDSPWVGFQQFERLFRTPDFMKIFRNTFVISLYKLIFGFPAPIILALLLNELKNGFFKRFTQSVLYLPHFLSWVIFTGIIVAFLNPVDGLVNYVLTSAGMKPINFMIIPDYFRTLLVSTHIYKEMGWGTIIYLAAMSGVNPDLYEAARVDGANKFKQMWHVTLPSIRSVILILMILDLGNILEAGFMQVFLLYNPLVYDVGDIIDTYVYRVGIQSANYSLATAAGVFKSVIALVLIYTANKIVRKSGNNGLW
ncbi:carbohydrate ABC transporter membrane protein 1 (CUT1 family) [Cohnella sp. SGD-V74]|uniref:ABC transporter permease n=1 Tax=unclassified Cohnella TaxID=2636738 RepID=UPI000D43B913|nr:MULTISPECIES: ABC transporter permease subunit [unclassified Cohnella]PRX61101.1 carbohydrate ABC transporter membrane protein 1 (CUT1 family) [Cohnella sp. SGD-V74]